MGHILLEVKDKIAVITMNRPEKRNALNFEVRRELHTVLQQVASDNAVRAVIITGAGEAFVAGADIEAMKDFTVEDAVQSSRHGTEVFSYIEKMKVPVIAAINGWALGGGLELALACDIRICSENARFGQPEVNIGILPGYGGTIRLPRIVGIGRAKEMIYFGKILSAREAEDYGLVSAVTTPEKLMDKAWKMGTRLSQGPASISLAKQSINAGMFMQADEALDLSSRFYGDAYKTGDTKEGIAAYLEKRKPEFRGN